MLIFWHVPQFFFHYQEEDVGTGEKGSAPNDVDEG